MTDEEADAIARAIEIATAPLLERIQQLEGRLALIDGKEYDPAPAMALIAEFGAATPQEPIATPTVEHAV